MHIFNIFVQMSIRNKYTVLVCPLDWGIGHASRCVPIIRELIKQDYNVIIGADNRPLDFLRIEFQNLKFVPFSGTTILYSANKSMALKMLFTFPRFLFGIRKEHNKLKQIVRDQKIDIVISDNRYGLWHKKIPSIFITHQIGIKTPRSLSFFKPLLNLVNRFFIQKHSQLWIPDFENEPNLSGSLSHGYRLKIPSYFIGPLSRFTNKKTIENNSFPEIVALVSGPEPQRSIFEEILIAELKTYPEKSYILRGKIESNKTETINNITLYPHLPTSQLFSLLKKANLIICRPGYSTLMDLAVLNKKAVLVPTPGQTEQEYLARKLKRNGSFFSESQTTFSLDTALSEYQSYSGIQLVNNYKILQNLIKLLKDIK